MATKQDAKRKAPQPQVAKPTPQKPDWPEFKDVFLFDMASGAFTMVYKAQLSPMPDENDQYDYICPVHHLKDAPPEPPAGMWPCAVNGQWVMKPDHRGKMMYNQTDNSAKEVTAVGEVPPGWGLEKNFSFQIEEAAADARIKITEWKAAAMAQDVVVKVSGKPFKFQADENSAIRLSRTVSMVEKKAVDCPPIWRSSDNLNVPVTLEDLQAIEVAVTKQMQQAMIRSWQLKDELDAAIKKGDLNTINNLVW